MSAQDAATWALRMVETIKLEETTLRRVCWGPYQEEATRELAAMGDTLVAGGMPVLPDPLLWALSNDSGFTEPQRKDIAYWTDDLLQRRLWQRTRVTYAVDPELWRALGEVDDSDVLHADVFNYLPHPNPFIAFPEPIITTTDREGEEQHIVGMLVTGRSRDALGLIGEMRVSTDDPRSGGIGLLFFGPVYKDGRPLVTERGVRDAVLNRVGIDFKGEETITFGQLMVNVRARYTGPAWSSQGAGEFVEQIDPALRRSLSTLVYICATNAEVEKAPAQSSAAAVRTITGEGARSVKPPRVFDVGVRVGAALQAARKRQAEAPAGRSTGRKMAPHVRRAHPHTYWCGPGRQERRIRWVFPVLVNADGHDLKVTTVHPVRSPAKAR